MRDQLSTPLVSVLMSVYNEPISWVQESIESILQQTYSNFEFIIILDNPVNLELKKLIQDYANNDNRIKIVLNDANIGLTKSLNKGLRTCSGVYIARMDADDISMLNRFEVQVAFMQKHLDIGVCGSNVMFFGNINKIEVFPENHNDCLPFQEAWFAHPVVMIRKSVFDVNNIKYNEDFRFAQDFELWSRLYYLTKFYNIQSVLLNYRWNDQQISTKNRATQCKLAASIRRRSFVDFCNSKNIDYHLSNQISIKDITYTRNIIPLRLADSKPEYIAINDFIYFMYRSITKTNPITSILYCFISGDIFKLRLRQVLSIVHYHLNRGKRSPIL